VIFKARRAMAAARAPVDAGRRMLLLGTPALILPAWQRAHGADADATLLPGTADAPVVPGTTLRFPLDEGSHPAFRIEWWYVTGWLRDASGADLGFQVTFFRHRVGAASANPSRFAAQQLIAVHAAVSDPRRGKLVHVQRVARAAFDRAVALEGRTDVRVGHWMLAAADDRFIARIEDRSLTLELVLMRTQAPLLHGENGFSRKGPSPESASYYYTLPQLRVRGTVATAGSSSRVEGHAWLDHEWSSAAMEAAASGWDWIGINLDDGGALMAFRMRDAQGGALWTAATLRDPSGRVTTWSGADVGWTSLRQWRSPRTGATYPVAWRVIAGPMAIELDPLMDDQEQDARVTTGTVYWEGAVTARTNGTRIGLGYLEMTGYAGTFRL
jgi:predicted secreted hydrolase